ncbi:beta-barrel assembly-enhancing protease [Thalassotalea fusca]
MLNIKPLILATSLSSLLAIASTSAIAQDKNKLPDIGAAGGSILSIEKERQIGKAMMKQLRATQPIINDPVLIEYINDLGNKMVRNANDVNYGFEFFIIDNKELNAFAFFGGHIGIHSGLLTTADNESELASVIGHEISHVTQRHLARRLEAQSRAQPLTMAGMVSGVLLALVNPTVGMAALSTSMAAAQQSSINYTRSNEKEADRVGIALLANSGFDPNGAPNFFAKMAEKYRYQSKPPAMLLTHPLPDSRITDARVRAQGYGTVSVPPKLEFGLAKARIQSRYEGNPKDNIKHFEQQLSLEGSAFKAVPLYGLANAYFKNKEYDKAEKILTDLYQADKRNLFYADVLSDIYIETKNFDAGIKMLSELFALMPNNQVVTLNYANVLQEAGDFSKAEVLLQDFLILSPDNFIAHDLLTTVYRKQQKTDLMHISKAEVYALMGGYAQAVDELQTGYKYANDKPLIRKRIKARILQLQEMENKLKRLN